MEPSAAPASSEPIAVTEAVRSLLIAVMVALTAFGAWEPTPEQTSAVLGLYLAISVVLSVVARKRSTPTSKVALTTEQLAALQAPPPH